MAQANSMGTIWPGYSRYTAQAMGECLDQVIEARILRGSLLPSRLLEAAKDFLRAALNAQASEGLYDPSIGIANYRLAASALRSSNPMLSGSRAEFATALRNHLELLETLSQERSLSDNEIRSLETLRSFFVELFRVADGQSYREALEAVDEDSPGLCR